MRAIEVAAVKSYKALAAVEEPTMAALPFNDRRRHRDRAQRTGAGGTECGHSSAASAAAARNDYGSCCTRTACSSALAVAVQRTRRQPSEPLPADVQPIRVAGVGLRVADLERSRKFYTEVLGLKVGGPRAGAG